MANDEEARIRQGTWFDPTAGKITFVDYFETNWFPNKGGEVNTLAKSEMHYRACLQLKWGDVELRRILPSSVQGWVTQMTLRRRLRGNVKARFTALQTILAGRRGVSAGSPGCQQQPGVQPLLDPAPLVRAEPRRAHDAAPPSGAGVMSRRVVVGS